jgi:hypothetical protein
MSVSVGLVASSVSGLHRAPLARAAWAVAPAAAKSTFPAAALIVVLIVIVLIIAVLAATFFHLSWYSGGRRLRRLNRIQRAADEDVAEMRRNDDLYDPNGPGLHEDDL